MFKEYYESIEHIESAQPIRGWWYENGVNVFKTSIAGIIFRDGGSEKFGCQTTCMFKYNKQNQTH